MSNQSAGSAPSGPPYKRKFSNFLINKQLQLRYILVVVCVSSVIATALGFLIYQQSAAASAELNPGLASIGLEEVADSLATKDSALIVKMVGVGIGLTAILSTFLLIMTHKVAGPLFKVSLYFDRLIAGRLAPVTALRKGDMLQDFFTEFAAMHNAVRERQGNDAAVMQALADALTAPANAADTIAAGHALATHASLRRDQLEK